jgi:hypothetical protein
VHRLLPHANPADKILAACLRLQTLVMMLILNLQSASGTDRSCSGTR